MDEQRPADTPEPAAEQGKPLRERVIDALRSVFDPEHRANPHKLLPDAKVCVEARAPRRQAAM